uniref:Uncharacterized protein n=1 Tax=Glossina brevipalpis TaxID=37001 RepID=A0A1A9WC06_9MUSC
MLNILKPALRANLRQYYVNTIRCYAGAAGGGAKAGAKGGAKAGAKPAAKAGAKPAAKPAAKPPAGDGGALAKQSLGVSPKILRYQKHFQKKNNVPVFLKGGQNDVILYYTTLALSGLGLILNIVFFFGYIID